MSSRKCPPYKGRTFCGEDVLWHRERDILRSRSKETIEIEYESLLGFAKEGCYARERHVLEVRRKIERWLCRAS